MANEEFFVGLQSLIRARKWDTRLRREGVTLAQASVLDSLAGGPTTIGELAEIESVKHSVMSELVDKLERLGLAKREPAGRKTVVNLTDDGEAMLMHLAPIELVP